MSKKIIALLFILVILICVPLPASAADGTVTLRNTSGVNFFVTIIQNGALIYNSNNGSGSYTAADNGGDLIVNISPDTLPAGVYATINSELKKSGTYPWNVGSISVDILRFIPPSISLSVTSNGGISYEITDNSPVSSYEITVYENNALKGTMIVTSKRGSLLQSFLSEGKSYTAAARVSGNGYVSDQGAWSNAVTVPVLYSLLVKGTDGGSVSDVSDSYISGSKITLKATPSTGYAFVEWTTSGEGEFENKKKSETVFTMPSKNVTVTAVFSKTFKFVIMSSTGGKVWDVDGNYYKGQEIKVSAIPGDGYTFDSWVSSDGGKFEDSKAVATIFTMPENATTVTATFKEISTQPIKPDPTDPDGNGGDSDIYEIKTAVDGKGNIVINQNKAHKDQKITVRATAQAGYVFQSWSSEGGGSFADINAAATTFSMPDGNVTIIATFVQGDGNPDTNPDNKPPVVEPNKPASKSLIITIGVGLVVAAAAVLGIVLVARERARRQEADDDDYYSDDDDEEPVVYDYDEATGEIQAEEEDNTEGTERKNSNSKSWRQQRKRRNQYSDNVYHSDDWDD